MPDFRPEVVQSRHLTRFDALRPDQMRVSASRYPTLDNAVQAVIEEIAFHGQAVTVLVNADGLDTLISASLTVQELDSVELDIGLPVWCQWDAVHGRLLPDNIAN